MLNEKILLIFFKAGYIETWGLGIEKIIAGGLQVTFIKASKETVGETVGEILELLNSNGKITRAELSEKIGLSIRGIEWHLKNLKEKGVIKRIGSTKSGFWKVLK